MCDIFLGLDWICEFSEKNTAMSCPSCLKWYWCDSLTVMIAYSCQTYIMQSYFHMQCFLGKWLSPTHVYRVENLENYFSLFVGMVSICITEHFCARKICSFFYFCFHNYTYQTRFICTYFILWFVIRVSVTCYSDHGCLVQWDPCHIDIYVLLMHVS